MPAASLSAAGQEHMGLLAQELENVCPDLVHTNDSGYERLTTPSTRLFSLKP